MERQVRQALQSLFLQMFAGLVEDADRVDRQEPNSRRRLELAAVGGDLRVPSKPVLRVEGEGALPMAVVVGEGQRRSREVTQPVPDHQL